MLADAATVAAESLRRTMRIRTKIILLATRKWEDEPALYVNGLHIGSGLLDPQIIANSIAETLIYSEDPGPLGLMAASATILDNS